MEHIRDLIAYLIYEKNWYWLHALISLLCETEMKIRLLLDKEYYEKLSCAGMCTYGEKPYIYYAIPHNTLYCDGCPFRHKSEIADVLFGYQSSGWCDLIGRGDFSFVNPTDLLWDGCKECGYYEWEEDEEV